MTPDETSVMIEGWNAGQRASSGQVAAPSAAEFDELVAKYG